MSSIFNFANLLLYGVPLLCAAIVMILLISAVVLKVRTAGAKSWPQTPGIVVSALIEQQNDEGTLNYRPLIAYQYQVNGRAYQSDHLAFGRQTSWQQGERGQRRVIEHVRQYPVNGAVTAHYNPSNPADAVLEVHTTGFSSLIGVAIVLGVIGAGWWLGANWLSRQ